MALAPHRTLRSAAAAQRRRRDRGAGTHRRRNDTQLLSTRPRGPGAQQAARRVRPCRGRQHRCRVCRTASETRTPRRAQPLAAPAVQPATASRRHPAHPGRVPGIPSGSPPSKGLPRGPAGSRPTVRPRRRWRRSSRSQTGPPPSRSQLPSPAACAGTARRGHRRRRYCVGQRRPLRDHHPLAAPVRGAGNSARTCTAPPPRVSPARGPGTERCSDRNVFCTPATDARNIATLLRLGSVGPTAGSSCPWPPNRHIPMTTSDHAIASSAQIATAPCTAPPTASDDGRGHPPSVVVGR